MRTLVLLDKFNYSILVHLSFNSELANGVLSLALDFAILFGGKLLELHGLLLPILLVETLPETSLFLLLLIKICKIDADSATYRLLVLLFVVILLRLRRTLVVVVESMRVNLWLYLIRGHDVLHVVVSWWHQYGVILNLWN